MHLFIFPLIVPSLKSTEIASNPNKPTQDNSVQDWSQLSLTGTAAHHEFSTPHLPHVQCNARIHIHMVVPFMLKAKNIIRKKKSDNFHKTQKDMLRKKKNPEKHTKKLNVLSEELNPKSFQRTHLCKSTEIYQPTES